MTDDLTAYLLARFDEEAFTARIARACWPPGDEIAGQLARIECGAHAHRWNPDRVLAEVDAKRRLIEGCQETLAGEDSWDPMTAGGTDEPYMLARFTLRCLAHPYADRPDFRQEWKL